MLPKFIAIACLCLLVSACASSAGSSNATLPADAAPTSAQSVAEAQAVSDLPANDPTEGLVARVNGQDITRATFDRQLVRTRQQLLAASEETLLATVLDTLVEQTLIEQEAALQAVVITDEAVEAEFQANRSLAASEAAWQQWLTENLYTEEEFRQSVREQLIAATMRDRVIQNMPDTVAQIHARHILVNSEQEARTVLQRLQGGEDFAALAATLSRDVTTREQGGDLGWFAEGDLLEPTLAQTAFALNTGEIGGPVPTRLGYHIVQTLESAERPVTPEKRARMAQGQFENWVRRLSFNAIIERYLP